MFTELIKSIGVAQGVELSLPSNNIVPYYDQYGGYAESVMKSQAWKPIANVLSGLDKVPTDGDYKAFIDCYAAIPWVYICCWVIASSIASLPLVIYEGRGDKKQVIEEGDLYNLLSMPNPFDDLASMLELTTIFLELTGMSYWEKSGNYKGVPVNLYNLEPYYMDIVPHPTKKIDHYTYEYPGNNKPIIYRTDEIVPFKYANPSSQFFGQGSIKALQVTLITELMRETFNKSYIENEARPDVIITQNPDVTKGQRPMTSVEREEASHKWSASFGGPRKARRPIILGAGIDIKTLTESTPDMAYQEFEKSLRERVLGSLGVPPALVGLFEYANYANTREQLKIFWNVTIPPKCQRIASTITRHIFRPIDPNMWCEFDRTEIPALEEDPKEKTERLNTQFDRGIINRNEYRSKFGYGKVEDEHGDKPVMLSQYVPIEDIFAEPPEIDEGAGESEASTPFGGMNDEEEDYQDAQDKESEGKDNS